jgi:hypothetical protein
VYKGRHKQNGWTWAGAAHCGFPQGKQRSHSGEDPDSGRNLLGSTMALVKVRKQKPPSRYQRQKDRGPGQRIYISMSDPRFCPDIRTTAEQEGARNDRKED